MGTLISYTVVTKLQSPKANSLSFLVLVPVGAGLGVGPADRACRQGRVWSVSVLGLVRPSNRECRVAAGLLHYCAKFPCFVLLTPSLPTPESFLIHCCSSPVLVSINLPIYRTKALLLPRRVIAFCDDVQLVTHLILSLYVI